MSYWWVNHKQTYAQELEGGYIWSPKENANGAKNQTYINLTLTKVGDVVFSYAFGKIKAIGLVSSACEEAKKPSEINKPGNPWSEIGWLVCIDWEPLSQPILPKAYINEISPLLPSKYSPIQENGNGNQGCYLASIDERLAFLLISLINQGNPDVSPLIEQRASELEEQEIIENLYRSSVESTVRQQLIKARQGQGRFRKNLERIESRCRVTGLSDKRVMIASHIKPWRVSNNDERLDGNNGLLLSPHIDKLFDQGWITFDAKGELLCCSEKIKKVLLHWHIALPLNVGAFNRQQSKYLDYHRCKVYRG